MGGKTAPSSDPEAEKKERQRKIMGIRQKVIINTVSKKKKKETIKNKSQACTVTA